MSTLSKVNLFWDIDPKTLDILQHRRFIIVRILARGNLDDFAWAKKTYSEDDMKDALCSSRSLDNRSLNFWLHYFHIAPQACTQKSSKQTPGAFSVR